MYQRIVVPVDGSSIAWRAMTPALELAERWDCPVVVVSVVRYDFEVEPARAEIDALLAAAGWTDRADVRVVEGVDAPVGEYVDEVVNEEPGSLVVMSSTGRGRSAAVIGSVAETILRHTEGPVLLYGPNSDLAAPTSKPILVAITGAHSSEAALGPAGAWAVALDATPWVVTVGDPRIPMPPDAAEWALASTKAEELSELAGIRVEFETLHDENPTDALIAFAESTGAGLLVEATHARKGLRRLLEGSVAMSSVHRASCPVLAIRAYEDDPDD